MIALDLPLTRRDLASVSGTALSAVSRALESRERRGRLRTERYRLVLLDPKDPENLAGE